MKEEHYNLMNKGIVIENPIYPKTVVVFRGDSIKKCLKYFKSVLNPDLWIKHENKFINAFDKTYKGLCFVIPEGDVFIHLLESAGTGTIVHEAFHAVEFQFDDYGISWGEPPNEPYAYYLAFLVKEIVNNLYK